MECVETALKTSLRKDITPQTFVDEISVLNAQNGTTSDDFFVDDLLDFSHVEEQQQEQDEQQEHSPCLSLKQNHETSNPNTTFSLKEDYPSLPTNELNVPVTKNSFFIYFRQYTQTLKKSKLCFFMLFL